MITDANIRIRVQRTEPNNLQTYGSPANTSAPNYVNKGSSLNVTSATSTSARYTDTSLGAAQWRQPAGGMNPQLVIEYTGSTRSEDYPALALALVSGTVGAGSRLEGSVRIRRARHSSNGLGTSCGVRVSLEAYNGSTNLGTVAQGEGAVTGSNIVEVKLASTRATPTGTTGFRAVIRWRGQAIAQQSAVGLSQWFVREVPATSSTTNAPGWYKEGQLSTVRIVPSGWAHGDNAYEATVGAGTSAAFAPVVAGITPNSWVGVAWTVLGDEGRSVRVRIEEFDSAGTKLREQPISPYIAHTGTAQRIEQRVQVGANTARIRTNLIWSANQGVVQWGEVTVVNAATVDGLADLGFIESFPYVNRVPNPNGKSATFGWQDPLNTVDVTAIEDGMRITARSTVQQQYAATTLVPVEAYQAVSVRIKARTAPYVRVGVGWANGVGGRFFNAADATPTHPAFANDEEFVLILPPLTSGDNVNKKFASFAIELFSDAGMTQRAPVGSWVEISNPTLYQAATAEELSGYLPFMDEVRWVDITGTSKEVDIARHGTDLGNANIRMHGVSLDPVKSASLHRGRAVKVEAINNGTYQTVFTGTVLSAVTDYLAGEVSFSAIDASAVLHEQRWRNAYMTLSAASYMLARSTILWEINGRTDVTVTTEPQIVYRDAKTGTMKRMLTMIRDQVGGYWWIDRNGVLRVYDVLPSGTPVVLSDTPHAGGGHYSAVEATSNTEDLINSVTTTRYTYSNGTQTEADPVTITDAASVRKYGLQNIDLDLMGSTVNATTFSNSILARHAQVRPMVKSADVPVNETNMAWLTRIDLFDRVNVVVKGVTYQVRVDSIDHIVTPDGWMVKLVFRTLDGIAAKVS